MGHEGFVLVTGLHGDGLSLGAGGFHRLATWVEFDREISQMEFVGIGTAPADSGLELFNLPLLELSAALIVCQKRGSSFRI